MLINFTVGNFLSFDKEQEFSMVAASIREKNIKCLENVYAINDNLKILKSAVIYGANASGKSNFLKAFSFYKEFIYSSTNVGEHTKPIAVPFLLKKSNSEKPSMFEAIFIKEEVIYTYGFKILKNKILEEWLNIKKQRETSIFHRNGSEIEINSKYSVLTELRDKKMIREDALLLSLGAQFNSPVSMQIFDWLKNFNIISGLEDLLYRNYSINMLKNPEKKSEIINLLKVADMGINNLDVIEFKEKNSNEFESSISENPNPKPSFTLRSVVIKKDVFNDKEKIIGQMPFIFDFNESEGTKKYFHLLGPILDVLEKGRILVVDELDTKLHPLLTERIVKLFNCSKTNPKNAQLIFATHDVNLLDADLFRRDQIWFTEKNKIGATELYSLIEFKDEKNKKVRNDERIRKNYITGKYGGTPYLGDFDENFE